MEKENQRVVITKHLLKQGLLRLLKEKSLNKISVSELCRESGINRATFYRHFETPYDVLVDIELDAVNEIRNLVEEPESRSDLERNLEKICTYLYVHGDVIRVFFRSNSDADISRMLNDLFQRFLLEKGKPKRIQDLDTDSARLIHTFLAGGSYLLVRQWLMEDIPKSPQEIAALVYRVMEIGNTGCE